MTEIITGLLAKISDGDQVRTYLLTTGAYHDLALANHIEFGTALPVIPRQAGLSIREQVMFQPQGGTSGVNLSNIPLINSEGDFDDWGGWYLSGLEQIIKRGYADQAWADWTDLVVGVGKGKPEFIGRERVVISIRGSFAYMSQPVANQVFDDTVGNERLENVTVPMVFGSAYQVPALLSEPALLIYAAATNANDIPSVQEGGNPSDVAFAFVPNGFQLFASPTLKITANVTGPPLAGFQESDALDGIGTFGDWTSGYPDGWTVSEDSPYAVINEESGTGFARVENTAKIDGDTGWVTAGTWIAPENPYTGLKFEPHGTASLTDALEADDGTYAKFTQVSYNQYQMIGSGWTFGLTADVAPVGVESRITLLNDGGGTTSVQLNKFYLKYPDDTARSLKESGDVYFPTTKGTEEWGGSTDLPSGLTKEILEDADFELVMEKRRTSSDNGEPQVHEIALKVHYGTIVEPLRLTTDNEVLTQGNRYLIRIHHRGGSGDSVEATWGGVSNETEDIPGVDDPFAQTTAQLESDDVFEGSFVAKGKRFAIQFERGNGNGEQTIEQIELLDLSGYQDRFSELVQYIHEQAGKTPADVCDITALDDLETKAENPRLGWWVKNETTREQLCILFAQSLGGATWGGLDGKWTAAQMRIPQQPSGDYLEITGSFDPGHAKADPGKGLTDRVWAAKNWHPIPEDSTAGVTTTWTEADRQQVVADWRITEKADFSNLEGFATLTIDSLDPSSGDIAGSTSVTITGTGFSDFGNDSTDSVTFDGDEATNVTVVSSTEITCDTPAGPSGGGSVDVVITIGSESATLEGAFEYEEPLDPSTETTLLWLKSDDAASLTLDGSDGVEQINDKSGNGHHFEQTTAGDRPLSGASTQNGKNVLDFAGDHLVSTEAMSAWTFLHDGTEYEVFAVAKFGTSSNPDSLYGLMGNTGGSSNTRRGISYWYDDRSAIPRSDSLGLLVSNGGSSYPSRVAIEHYSADDFFPANQFNLVELQMDPDNGTQADRSVIVNPVSDSTDTTNEQDGSVSASDPNYSTLNIGALGQGDFPLTGSLAEIIIVPGPLTESKRQEWRDYLTSEWGLS